MRRGFFPFFVAGLVLFGTMFALLNEQVFRSHKPVELIEGGSRRRASDAVEESAAGRVDDAVASGPADISEGDTQTRGHVGRLRGALGELATLKRWLAALNNQMESERHMPTDQPGGEPTIRSSHDVVSSHDLPSREHISSGKGIAPESKGQASPVTTTVEPLSPAEYRAMERWVQRHRWLEERQQRQEDGRGGRVSSLLQGIQKALNLEDGESGKHAGARNGQGDPESRLLEDIDDRLGSDDPLRAAAGDQEASSTSDLSEQQLANQIKDRVNDKLAVERWKAELDALARDTQWPDQQHRSADSDEQLRLRALVESKLRGEPSQSQTRPFLNQRDDHRESAMEASDSPRQHSLPNAMPPLDLEAMVRTLSLKYALADGDDDVNDDDADADNVARDDGLLWNQASAMEKSDQTHDLLSAVRNHVHAYLERQEKLGENVARIAEIQQRIDQAND